ncbi:MAG: hypothetical protein EAX96_18535 [Candidatus Lokiarchaeota archaeon]|nr:hypothetical protein [Candidatus Lokiarchaeota archaeon]
MIESIYIIDVNSGVSLFNLDLIEFEDSKKIDSDIFSGFLKVIDDLSQESRNEEVNSIILASSRLIYEKQSIDNRKLLFISVDNQKKKSSKIRQILQNLAQEFKEDYKDEIVKFSGNISVFKPFEEKVRKIMTLEFGSYKEKYDLIRKEHPLIDFKEQFMRKRDELKEKMKKNREEFKLKRKILKRKKKKKSKN